ncbi:hypothetical protein [Spirosoma endbachense]|uniref:Uncharacterized protein n=1 Tax=Spirosoma endbachense TaxID=2666025 RepID=A0A6P1VSR1_9BACT|nr:hypothetical protein [Spirosoma endbachense]QHV96271.1 hypothetical protein GJR95_15160 [Spirosoma endbachense]
MTTAELDALPSGTIIYLPTDWEVQTWLFDGRVRNRDYYTLTYPPDTDGIVSNRRPVYLHALDLLNATRTELEAWKIVLDGLEKRQLWVSMKIVTL